MHLVDTSMTLACDVRNDDGSCLLYEHEPSPIKKLVNVNAGTLIFCFSLLMYMIVIVMSFNIISANWGHTTTTTYHPVWRFY